LRLAITCTVPQTASATPLYARRRTRGPVSCIFPPVGVWSAAPLNGPYSNLVLFKDVVSDRQLNLHSHGANRCRSVLQQDYHMSKLPLQHVQTPRLDGLQSYRNLWLRGCASSCGAHLPRARHRKSPTPHWLIARIYCERGGLAPHRGVDGLWRLRDLWYSLGSPGETTLGGTPIINTLEMSIDPHPGRENKWLTPG
jgi:hypothetical protein